MAGTRLAVRLDRVRATGLTRDRLPGWPAISLAGNFRVTQRRSACHRTTSGARSVTHDAGLGPPSLILPAPPASPPDGRPWPPAPARTPAPTPPWPAAAQPPPPAEPVARTPARSAHLYAVDANPRTARDICPAADSRQGLRRAPGGPVGAGPHERFRNTTVCTGRDHPSRQHTGPAGRPGGNTRSAFRPSPCRATPVTLRSEARLRTATRNACSASQATQNADQGYSRKRTNFGS